MKTKIIFRKLSGFTLIELMITIAIIAILVTLATPSSFYQQTTAVNYATRATQHAKIFSSYINDNYTTIYNNAKTLGPQSITASTVASYTGGIVMQDNYGAVPCATVRYNATTQKLEMYMYYSGGSGIIPSVIASANNYLSGISGQLVGGNYVGAFGTWSNLSSTITSAACGTSSANGLAINLNLLTTQAGNMQSDLSLHRTLDNANPVGTQNNYNTMQTDIVMGYIPAGSTPTTYSGIFFDESAIATVSPYLTSGSNTKLVSPYKTNIESDVVAANATLVANAFVPIGTATINQSCTQADLGRIVRNDATPTAGIPQSDLICSYNTLICGVTSPYCYLSISDTTSRLRANTSTSVTYTCPAGTGIIDRSVPPVFGNIVTSPNTSTNCRYTEVGPRVLNYPTATSVTVSTTWLLVYTTLTSGSCNTTGSGITVGVSTLSGGNYAPAIAFAACSQ